MKTRNLRFILFSVLAGAGLIFPPIASAHCDTMDGPVVQAAKTALEKKDVTPVLKWVKRDSEAEVKVAFSKTLVVRAEGPEARELADRFFFETLVRLHRASEGEPFTGLKPAGTELEPGIAEADKALETGSVDAEVKRVMDETAAGIRKRFTEAREKKQHAEESVEAGREYVAAYVAYMHYVEGLHQAIQGAGNQHEASAAQAGPKVVPHQHNH
jgi:hypothetical protein